MSKQNQGDCAVYLAVIGRCLQAWPGFTPNLLHVGLVLRKATVGQVFLKEPTFFPPLSFYELSFSFVSSGGGHWFH